MGQSVIVIGAGIAGLRCATVLAEAGLDVTVMDKARGPGGRCSTRRHEGFRFDHGAQYFTARSPAFRQQVDTWLDQGAAARWEGRLVSIDAAGVQEPLAEQRERYIGTPGMNGIAKVMAKGLNCLVGSRVVSIQRASNAWKLTTEAGETLESELLVMTPPPAQTADLLAGVAPELAERVQRVAMHPSWALMLGFTENPVTEFDGALVEAQPVGWMASSRGKAGRSGRGAWIVHASVAFSERNLEDPADTVAAELFESFCRLTGQRQPPVEMVAHRWRYAMAAEPLGVGFLSDRTRALWVAGDWCNNSRIEGAWLSGQAAAEDLLSTLQ